MFPLAFQSRFKTACALSAAALLLTSCTKKSQPSPAAMMAMMVVPVRAVPAVSTNVPLTTTAVGNVEPMASVDVKSRVAGQILHVYFNDGQDVHEGQQLFEIDPEPLQRQIAELQADIAKDVAQEAQARANVLRDEAQQKQARSSADRAEALAKEGIFSKEQTEQSVATADAAKASLDADRAAVESASAANKADHARLAQTQLQLTYTKVTAPITGRAGAIAVKAGNLVKENDTTLVTILQTSPIYVSFGLPEQTLNEVRKYAAQHPLEVQAKVNGGTETGTLRFIDNTVDTTTGAIKMKAVFANADHQLWPGQFVDVQTRLRIEPDRIIVPSRTVQTGPEGKYVWVMQPDNTAAIRQVNVLRLFQPANQPEQAVIGSGLKPGDMVISEGQMRLMPGAKVRLLKQDNQQLGQAFETDASDPS